MAGHNVDVELWNLRVPLDPPIVSPRGAVTETCLLLVFLSLMAHKQSPFNIRSASRVRIFSPNSWDRC